MNISLTAAGEIRRQIKTSLSLADLSVQGLSSEITRLEKLRSRALRLNEQAFLDEVSRAERMAPGLVASNAMFSRGMIDEELQDLRASAQVIGEDLLHMITERIMVCRQERARRNAAARKLMH